MTEVQTGVETAAAENPAIEYETTTPDEGDEVIATTPNPEVTQTETPQEEDDEKQGEAKHKKGGYVRKLEKLDQQLAAERERNLMLMAELERNRSGGQELKPKDGPPQIEDFNTFAEFNAAEIRYQTNEAVKQALQGREQQVVQAQAEQEYIQRMTAYNERVQPLLEEYPDFYDRAQQLYDRDLVTPALETVVTESPIGEKITLHYIENPQELVAMRNKSEAQIIREVAKLEARLESQEPTRTTKAPQPITPVKPNASVGTKDPKDMSQQEFEKWYYAGRT